LREIPSGVLLYGFPLKLKLKLGDTPCVAARISTNFEDKFEVETLK
jgi:hypothetical protein